jgi:hypothetical protein
VIRLRRRRIGICRTCHRSSVLQPNIVSAGRSRTLSRNASDIGRQRRAAARAARAVRAIRGRPPLARDQASVASGGKNGREPRQNSSVIISLRKSSSMARLVSHLPAFGLQHRDKFRCQGPTCFSVANEDICHRVEALGKSDELYSLRNV